MTFPVNAGSEKSDLLQPINFWAGEAPIITGQATITATGAVSYKRGQIFQLGSDGVAITIPATSVTVATFAAANKVILGQDIDITAAGTYQVPIYTGGFFNMDALTYPTLAAAYQPKEIFVKEIASGTVKLGKVLS
jgi:hypothetical protein